METRNFHVGADKEHAELEINGTYTAAELERLIGELSRLRAEMSPAVPTAPPTSRCPDDVAATRAGGDPCVQVAVMRDGMTRFWVRHAGLGWFGFNLPVERASMLASYILGITNSEAQVPQEPKRRKSDLH